MSLKTTLQITIDLRSVFSAKGNKGNVRREIHVLEMPLKVRLNLKL